MLDPTRSHLMAISISRPTIPQSIMLRWTMLLVASGCVAEPSRPATTFGSGSASGGPWHGTGGLDDETGGSTDGDGVSTTGGGDDAVEGGASDTDDGRATEDDGADASDDDAGTSDDPSGSATAGETDPDPTPPNECRAPGDPRPCDADSDDPFQAIGLNCPYDENQATPIFNESFHSTASDAWRVARQFGSHVDATTSRPIWGPREGEKFLIISSGRIAAPNSSGVITMPNASHEPGVNNANPDRQSLPSPMTPNMGSNEGRGGTPFVDCDGLGDCSDSLEEQWIAGEAEANDLLWFQFDVEVPAGTHGFEFDFAYFSAEFPEWVNSQFNDIFVVWSTSETYTGNLCFVNDQPCTVTALWPVPHRGNAAELDGTGFRRCSAPFFGSCTGGWTGGGTGWYTARASAAPNETLQLTWAIFDMGDSILDTAVIIDNWRWDCVGCVPSATDDCGITPVPQ